MGTQQSSWDLGRTGWQPSAAFDELDAGREAAFFYGLFLRGHSTAELRRDITVPRDVQVRWQKTWRHEPLARQQHGEILDYRRRILAIFDTLVSRESATSHLRQ